VRAAVDASTAQPGAAVTLGIRPEHIALNDGRDSLSAQVLFVETLGAVTMAHLKHPASDETLTVQTPGERRLTVGETVSLSAAPADVHLFDAEGCAFPRL
jgi:multiple sugar transport system ATP-binding protein